MEADAREGRGWEVGWVGVGAKQRVGREWKGGGGGRGQGKSKVSH